MASSAQRFEAKVDRSGAHHVWTGARDARGIGQIRIDGRLTTACRLAWELAVGPLRPADKVVPCPDEASCVRIEHLSLKGNAPTTASSRSRHGSGSKRQLKPGVWKLTITAGRYEDGSVRRLFRTVHADNEVAASRELARFVTELEDGQLPTRKATRDATVDEAIEIFLTEHLREEKGREEKTVDDYRRLHRKWFSPEIGSRRVADVDPAMMDRIFGRMRRASLSRSRLNQARSLYAPFFRWAKSRKMTHRNPMLEFELPTSRHVSRERTPPEAEELSILLAAAVAVVPDVTPLLVLGAVTGMRRGELVGLRRSRIHWAARQLTVDSAVASTKAVKGTKTRKERTFEIDAGTVAMLRRHCEEMDERANLLGTVVPADGFVFSLEPDCAQPMPPDYMTRRVAVLKDHLGIADKRPETIALEDEALRLRRLPQSRERRAGRTGPAPKGGFSFADIGAQLGRSERWAALAVQSAERRNTAKAAGLNLNFDGSVLALRKFTSSELLDAGFNISVVAQRQGHGPQVLMKHHSRGRKSADRKAAEHLGRIVHRSE